MLFSLGFKKSVVFWRSSIFRLGLEVKRALKKSLENGWLLLGHP